jgi:ATP-binding cassette subfamily F protein 3
MVTRIADLDQKTVTLYTGNYDAFIDKKAQEAERLIKAAALQQKQIAHMEDFVRRFKAKATKAAQARSRIKALEKIDRIEVPQTTKRTVAFRFPQPPRSGQEVMRLEHIQKSYGANLVYTDLNFRIERGERVALVGPNGAGKSTLLKILANATSFEGARDEGYNVSISFYAQHQVEALDLNATALQEMERAANHESISQVRAILGAFLFSGDAVDKKVRVLSGGEKSRLALAKMLLNPANFLLLDEPTNHLDIDSCDVLEDALCDFEGTLCFVSHDRHFINNVATRVVHVEHGAALNYPGDYEYYHWKRTQEADAAAQAAAASPDDDDRANDSRKDRKRREADLRREKAAAMGTLKKDLSAAEDRIAALEQEKSKLHALLADPTLYENPTRARDATRRDAELSEALDAAFATWEDLAARVEAIEAAFS